MGCLGAMKGVLVMKEETVMEAIALVVPGQNLFVEIIRFYKWRWTEHKQCNFG